MMRDFGDNAATGIALQIPAGTLRRAGASRQAKTCAPTYPPRSDRRERRYSESPLSDFVDPLPVTLTASGVNR
jgi:hypothetical protein